MSVPELFIKVFNDPIYAENGLIVSFGPERPCWIIDPGLPPQAERMLDYLARRKLTPVAIVLTHAHGDHIAGIDAVRDVHAALPLYLAKVEWPFLADPMQNLSGLFGAGVSARPEHLHDLAPGDRLELDGVTWEIRETSGHSPGGRTIYSADLQLAFVGDAIFAGSIGRTDFPHSDHERLIRNLNEQILTLPEETRLIPGHGPATTVGDERRTNPYLT
jgi:glyoxylase-like metal-dependent hydrolase (beta-lactamase superfamily II)